METHPTKWRRLSFLPLLGVVLAACGGAVVNSAAPSSPSSAPSSGVPTTVPSAPVAIGAPSTSASASPAPASESPSQPPDTGGSTTTGDVPDNAVFLTYKDVAHGFSIQYVEGWQVTTRADGVVIHDKDSSETVAVVAPPSDIGVYISGTDLPALQAQGGFKLVRQDKVKVGATRSYDHLVFEVLSPPDPVTGKQIPSTVDRYYVPGTTSLAIVSLLTPNGVDNVDAFRQMIESFKWS
jgi:hypothetical protein